VVTAGAFYVPLDEHHVISTQSNSRIGQVIAKEAQTLGANVILIDEKENSVYKLFEQLEDYKKQYPSAFFIHAANTPTIEEAPILSVEGMTAITFGQKVVGEPMVTIMSDKWIDFSDSAEVNGQMWDATDAKQFAQAFWTYILQGEKQ